MQHIQDLQIVGIDESRPPIIRKEPYIELYFKLNHQAPKDWCQDFNDLMKNAKYPVKISSDKGVMIETWVRSPGEVTDCFEAIKSGVAQCSQEYISKIAERTQAKLDAMTVTNESSEQLDLNKIIANLKF